MSVDSYTMDKDIESIQSAKINIFTYSRILKTEVSTIIPGIALHTHFTHPFWALDTLPNHHWLLVLDIFKTEYILATGTH